MLDQGSPQQRTFIDDIREALEKAPSLRKGLVESLHIAMDHTQAQMCAFWVLDVSGDGKLHPMFCLGPEDITFKSAAPDEGMVGRAFASGAPDVQLTFDPQADPATQALFEHIEIRSALCMPLAHKGGCILFVNKNDDTLFTEAEVASLGEVADAISDALGKSDIMNYPAMKQAQPIIVARGLTREFQNGDQLTKVLQGVNLNIYEGEFLTVLGESGCGKSTFLNIIGGMDKADDGFFSFQGKDLSHASKVELMRYRRDNIGFIFQNYNLMPNLTALQNLQLIAELVKDPMDCREALRLVGLEDRMSQYPSQLSGGQQQRVSIARALVKRPKVIFADEPTAALDYATSIEVLQVLKEVMDQGATLVMVTHNEEITRMANRVVRIRRGKTYEITVNRSPVEASELVW